MPFFVLKAHAARFNLHGHEYEFGRPLFSTKLPRPQDYGLYISITDVDSPHQESYLFLSTAFVIRLMVGWGNQRECLARIVEFAEQNTETFARLVLNINANPDAHLKDGGAPWIVGSGDDAVHIYTLNVPPVQDASSNGEHHD